MSLGVAKAHNLWPYNPTTEDIHTTFMYPNPGHLNLYLLVYLASISTWKDNTCGYGAHYSAGSWLGFEILRCFHWAQR